MFGSRLLTESAVSLKDTREPASDFLHPTKAIEEPSQTLIPAKVPSGKQCLFENYFGRQPAKHQKRDTVLKNIDGRINPRIVIAVSATVHKLQSAATDMFRGVFERSCSYL